MADHGEIGPLKRTTEKTVRSSGPYAYPFHRLDAGVARREKVQRMNILLTNDDGYEAPGLIAAFEAVRGLGAVLVVAPSSERSACSHAITIGRPISVQEVTHPTLGLVYAVDGTPADCVRLAVTELSDGPIDLVVSGINRGANAGVDMFYSGTVAGAREAAILDLPAIAVSQSVRTEVETDWNAASEIAAKLIRGLYAEPLPAPGFWNINLPMPIPPDAEKHVHRVPAAVHPMPMIFNRAEKRDGRREYAYGASYWLRDVSGPSDYSVIRDGGIAVTAVPLFGTFPA